MNQSNVSHLPNVRAYVSDAQPRPRPRPNFQAATANDTPRPRPDFQAAASDAPRKRFVAKGHDAQLQDAQMNGLPVRITCLSGIMVKGLIIRRDKYTVTLQHEATCDSAEQGDQEIFYKHAIESVLIKKAA